MRLTEKQVEDYQEIYFKTFGNKLPKEEALVQAMALVKLVKTIVRPSREEIIREQQVQRDASVGTGRNTRNNNKAR